MSIDPADQAGFLEVLLGRSRHVGIGKKTSGIDNQGRISAGSALVDQACAPGKTAQQFVPSCGAGQQISVRIAAVENHHAGRIREGADFLKKEGCQ